MLTALPGQGCALSVWQQGKGGMYCKNRAGGCRSRAQSDVFQVTALECAACLDPVGGATCSETTTRGGDTLAHQVRAARAAGISVVLVHECDPTLGACEFLSLVQTTPQDLVADGLYARTAVAFHTGQHRAVSLSLFAREIGAVRYRLGMMKPRHSSGGAVVDPVVGPASSHSSSFSPLGYLGSPAGSRYLDSPARAGAHYLGSQAADRARVALEA